VSPDLRINGTTRSNRDEVIARARTAITDSGGWILDAKLFSNVSINLRFEIPASRIQSLLDALELIELHLSTSSVESIAHRSDEPSGDIAGSLQITFIHNEPDLRIQVPAIPG
jgi:hypothetical protein